MLYGRRLAKLRGRGSASTASLRGKKLASMSKTPQGSAKKIASLQGGSLGQPGKRPSLASGRASIRPKPKPSKLRPGKISKAQGATIGRNMKASKKRSGMSRLRRRSRTRT